MKKKHLFLLAIVFILCAALAVDGYITFDERGVTLFALKNTDGEDSKKIDGLYDVTFQMTEKPMGSVNLFVPKQRRNEINDAIYYIGLFGINRPRGEVEADITETEDFFIYHDETQTINVEKYLSFIHFVSNGKPGKSKEISGDTQAQKAAVKFIESKFLYLNYEETEVTFADGFYKILFIGRIGNIKNYAFPTSAIVDKYGNVLEFKYYSLHFERFSGTKIKSMEAAFQELPVDVGGRIAPGTKITLDRGNIVYIYENSIIQPAYLFEGETEDGKSFQSFVKAAVYD